MGLRPLTDWARSPFFYEPDAEVLILGSRAPGLAGSWGFGHRNLGLLGFPLVGERRLILSLTFRMLPRGSGARPRLGLCSAGVGLASRVVPTPTTRVGGFRAILFV